MATLLVLCRHYHRGSHDTENETSSPTPPYLPSDRRRFFSRDTCAFLYYPVFYTAVTFFFFLFEVSFYVRRYTTVLKYFTAFTTIVCARNVWRAYCFIVCTVVLGDVDIFGPSHSPDDVCLSRPIGILTCVVTRSIRSNCCRFAAVAHPSVSAARI